MPVAVAVDMAVQTGRGPGRDGRLPYNLPFKLPYKLLYNLPSKLLYKLPPQVGSGGRDRSSGQVVKGCCGHRLLPCGTPLPAAPGRRSHPESRPGSAPESRPGSPPGSPPGSRRTSSWNPTNPQVSPVIPGGSTGRLLPWVALWRKHQPSTIAAMIGR